MEDCVTEGEAMLPPMDLIAEDGRNEEKKSGFFSNHKIEEEEGKIGEEENDAKDEDKGVISSLISIMVSPLSFRTGEAETEEDENRDGDLKKGGEDREGGIIKNVISNLFHRSEGEAVVESEDEEEEEEEKKMEGDEEGKEKTQNGNGGEGIIGNLVSHLTTSIPDDAIPTADEATILINSLVRD